MKKALKFVVSLAFMLWLFHSMDWNTVHSVLQRADYYPVLAAFLLTLSGVFLGAYQWRTSISIYVAPPAFQNLFRMHWLGVFANHFLPSGLGGDVVKGVVISRRAAMDGIEAVASLVVSRLTGLWGVLLVLFVGGLFGDIHSDWIPRVLPLIALIAVMSIAPLSAMMTRYAERLLSIFGLLGQKMGEVLNRVAEIRRNSHLLPLICLGIVFQLLVIAQVMLVFKAIRVEVPLEVLVVVVPVCSIAWMLPISINGLGVREAAFVLFFGGYGINTEEAVLASLIVYLLTVAVSIPGGLWMFSYRREGRG